MRDAKVQCEKAVQLKKVGRGGGNKQTFASVFSYHPASRRVRAFECSHNGIGGHVEQGREMVDGELNFFYFFVLKSG